MNLEQFVYQTLIGITSAVAMARKENKFIAPQLAQTDPKYLHPRTQQSGRPVYTVDFDVAVSAARDSELGAQAKGGIISVLSASTDASVSEKHESISRIKFSVPVEFF
jgi:hypothetical protein